LLFCGESTIFKERDGGLFAAAPPPLTTQTDEAVHMAKHSISKTPNIAIGGEADSAESVHFRKSKVALAIKVPAFVPTAESSPAAVLRRVPPRKPKNRDVRPREYLTPGEVEKLASAAKKRGRYGERDAFAIRFCWRHGFRVSELCAFRWDQVDLEVGEIHVNRRKNGIRSIHPLRGEEMRALRALRRDNPEGRFVFMSERGAPWAPAGFAYLVARAGAAGGFAFKVHPHMLRHGCGYYYANQEKSTRSIQHWLGHRNIGHTVHYTELSSVHFKDW
jgi:type 1 fimbriae regulatory protein FimB/type 1 fimbriae regulatory protein FimE